MKFAHVPNLLKGTPPRRSVDGIIEEQNHAETKTRRKV
jgi:hypothetical protein